MPRVKPLIPPQFRSALDSAPDDFTLRLVIADWFAENGRAAEEDGLRWSVKKGRIPHHIPHSKYPYEWIKEDFKELSQGRWAIMGPVETQRSAKVPMSMYTLLQKARPTSVKLSNLTPVYSFDLLLTVWVANADCRKEWWEWEPPVAVKG